MESLNNHSSPNRISLRPTLLNAGAHAAGGDLSHRMLAPLERENRKTIAVDPARKRWGRRSVRATLAVVAAGVATAVIGWGSSDGSLLERMTATAPAGTPIADRAPAVSPVALKPLEPVHASAPASGPGTRVEPAVPTGVVAGAAATPDPAAAGPRRAAGSELASAAPANQARIRPKPRTGAFAGQAARPARPEASKPRAGKGREDPDIDLVAALIARLDRRGSDPNGAARPSAPPASAGSNRVAVRLQPCSAGRDPVPARRCRRPACAGHRGPVDACPAAPAPKTSQRRGAADVEAG